MSGFFSRITSGLSRGVPSGQMSSLSINRESDPKDIYALLDSYYFSNGLYDSVRRGMSDAGAHFPAVRELRNPTYSAVEFYPKKLWPGTLSEAFTIEGNDREEVRDAIREVWHWSNWQQRKQAAARYFARYGDLFLRIAVRRDREDKPVGVYIQLINPQHVSDFKTDPRGFITYLRYDATIMKNGSKHTHTEIWDEATGYKKYEHQGNHTTPVDSLADPVETAELSEFGIDFLPWIHAPFMDVGESDGGTMDSRGMALIWPCLTKIDEINLTVTRIASMLYRFNKATMAVMANAVDASGRPVRPPKFDDNSSVDVEDEEIRYLPGMARMEYMVPNINWGSHLQFLNESIEALKDDLPELRYYDISKSGETASGVALRYKMGPAIDRIVEARGNAGIALVRAHKMALSIAQYLELPGFEASKIGTYEGGGFEHDLSFPDPAGMNETDVANLIKTYVDMAMPLPSALNRFGGWNDDELATLATDRAAEGVSGAAPVLNMPVASQALRSQATTGAAIASIDPATIGDVIDKAARAAVAKIVKSGVIG